MTTLCTDTQPATEIWFRSQVAIGRHRTYLEFAEQEVIIPDGRHKGERFRCDIQPFSRLVLESLDWPYPEKIYTGPTQTGKTMLTFGIPVMYVTCELGENIVLGIPDADMWEDKWRIDLYPLFRASRYASLLPTKGAGSQGAAASAIHLKNGAVIRVMTGGSSDKGKAGFTTRNLAVTELDAFGRSKETSQEASQYEQLKGRTRASTELDKRITGECTLTTRKGLTFGLIDSGTDTRIAIPCQLCGEYVTPRREHIRGWENAENVIDARESSRWYCPSCSLPWTEQQRYTSNMAGVAYHKGQTVQRDGTVTGDATKTLRLGFTWGPVNSHFRTAADTGQDEWDGMRSQNPEDAERKLCQFVHAIPYIPPDVDLSALDPASLQNRTSEYARGTAPAATIAITMGVDVHKRHLQYTVMAWTIAEHGYVIDYGVTDVHSHDMQEEVAIVNALRGLNDIAQSGYSIGGAQTPISSVMVDCRYQKQSVIAACKEFGSTWAPIMGCSVNIPGQHYDHPKQKNQSVRMIGDHWYDERDSSRTVITFLDSDYWKSWLHTRISCPKADETAITFFKDSPDRHFGYVKHLTSEKRVEEFVPGKGTVLRWEAIRAENHKLDTTAYACAAANRIGFRDPVKREARQTASWFANTKVRR